MAKEIVDYIVFVVIILAWVLLGILIERIVI